MAEASLLEWSCVAVLGLLLILTALCQVWWKLDRLIRSWDVFDVLPYWTFFAPEPGRRDMQLLYRDKLPDGFLTSWRELPLTRSRRWHDFAWSPRRRLKKALYDAVMYIQQSIHLEAEVRMSVPYLLLLTFVSGIPRVYPAAKTQFLIMSTSALSDSAAEVVFLSDVHPR